MNNRFFDIQVNGYAGADFNQPDLPGEQLETACRALTRDGVHGILATIITADPTHMTACLNNLVRLRNESEVIKKMIRGFHIEGPFILNQPGYRGAHNSRWIKEPDMSLLQKLLASAEGLTKIVTLAPEIDHRFEMTRHLSRQSIVVSAGHCNPSLDTLRRAIDAGLSMFTHLGNGCPTMLDRHDNIIQRALALHDHLWLCFIADGIHIPLSTLNNYLQLADLSKVIITTDAISAAAAAPGIYSLGEKKVWVSDDKIARDPDGNNLAGSAATMQQCFDNLHGALQLTSSMCKKIMFDNPLRALKWS